MEPSLSSAGSTPDPRGSGATLPGDDLDANKNVINGDIAKDNLLPPILANRKSRASPPASLTYVTENPTYEGVKFVGLTDKDSICSSSSYGDESDDEDAIDEKAPLVPDGGWGWVIVLASMILSMVADGISFSFGLLYIEFLNHFGESKSKTSWIGSLFMSVPLMSGPVMSALVDRYGCRKMTILGGIISASGFIMATFANSIEMLLLTFGVIAGLGLGLCYVTAVVSIAYWFDKKRSLAVSLGACGTGIGTFVYAPMTRYFIEEFGWRGTILMLSGTFLNMCVCGAVMRDPEWWILEQRKQNMSNKSTRGASSCGSMSRISGGGESTFPGVEELRSLMKSGQTPECILSTLATSIVADKIENTAENENLKHLYNSVVSLPTFVKQSEKVPLEVLESLSANTKLYNVILENYPSLLHCRSCSENKLNRVPTDQSITRVPVTMSMKLKVNKKIPPIEKAQTISFESNGDLPNSPLLLKNENNIVALKSPPLKSPVLTPIIKSPKAQEPWLKRQFSTNQHYLKDIRMHRNSVMYRGAMMNIAKYRLRASSCPNIYRNSMIAIPQVDDEKWYDEVLDMIKSMFEFKMFLEFHFLLMSIGTLMLFIWFIVPYFYLADFMTRKGYSEDEGALQLSVIGITNTIGMVALGWAGDQPWMNVTKCYSVCLVCCGLTTLAYPLVTHQYWMLVLNSALFGLFFASNFSFTPIILVELIPLERFTTAYGLILLMQGIGNLIGPPLAGWIFDITQTWDLSFYVAGVWIVISGVLVGVIPYTKNFRIWGEAPLEKDLEKISQLSQKGSISIA